MERQTQGSIFPVCKSGSLQSRGEEPEVLGAGVLCGGSLQAALGVEGRGVREAAGRDVGTKEETLRSTRHCLCMSSFLTTFLQTARGGAWRRRRGRSDRSWKTRELKDTKMPKWEGRSCFRNQPLSGH